MQAPRTPRLLAGGLGEPEGPTLLDDGSWLVTELRSDRGCVSHIAADGRSRRVIRRTGRPNGIAVGADGIVWVAESGALPCVLALTLDGRELRRVTHVAGQELLWPNDLCFGPDGLLYVTDSGTRPELHMPAGKLRADYATAPYDGRVYAIEPSTGGGRIIDCGLRLANGIALGPDQQLYVAETLTGGIHRYDVSGAKAPRREQFATVLDPTWNGNCLRGPDGMAFSTDGRLWVAVFGQGDVTVLDSEGCLDSRLETAGNSPANVAFGMKGSGELLVAEHDLGVLEIHPAGADGLLAPGGS
jgi:gluconolactonase